MNGILIMIFGGKNEKEKDLFNIFSV